MLDWTHVGQSRGAGGSRGSRHQQRRFRQQLSCGCELCPSMRRAAQAGMPHCTCTAACPTTRTPTEHPPGAVSMLVRCASLARNQDVEPPVNHSRPRQSGCTSWRTTSSAPRLYSGSQRLPRAWEVMGSGRDPMPSASGQCCTAQPPVSTSRRVSSTASRKRVRRLHRSPRQAAAASAALGDSSRPSAWLRNSGFVSAAALRARFSAAANATGSGGEVATAAAAAAATGSLLASGWLRPPLLLLLLLLLLPLLCTWTPSPAVSDEGWCDYYNRSISTCCSSAHGRPGAAARAPTERRRVPTRRSAAIAAAV